MGQLDMRRGTGIGISLMAEAGMWGEVSQADDAMATIVLLRQSRSSVEQYLANCAGMVPKGARAFAALVLGTQPFRGSDPDQKERESQRERGMMNG